MTAQFWWGLAALPLGAVGLAVTIGLPLGTLWVAERWRRSRAFILRDNDPSGPTYIAALIALSKWATQANLPLGYRITISRDRPGMTPRNTAAITRHSAIKNALRAEHDKEAT